ncbi:MAG: PilZ domain-containing protein [Candidatus Omnitrophica bacterium]|nr:PilZ domain-containing protein [Candidatus Omnitrophota bacterium]
MVTEPNRAGKGMRVEQRRCPRLVCHTALQYRDILEPHAPYAGSLTHDLSAAGVKFQAAQWLPAQHRLLLQLHLPGVADPIRTIVQVVWTRKQSHSDQYEVGARFIQITAHDREAVAGYVERGINQLR